MDVGGACEADVGVPYGADFAVPNGSSCLWGRRWYWVMRNYARSVVLGLSSYNKGVSGPYGEDKVGSCIVGTL